MEGSLKDNTDDSIVEFLEESNFIEGVYDDTSLEQAIGAFMALMALEKLDLKGILLAHSILMLHQPIATLDKGNLRLCNVRVGGRICPEWQTVPFAINLWIESANKIPFFIHEIKHLHVSFEHLHPFVDGNGRIGRMLLNWHRLKSGHDILVIKEAEKQKYYKWFDLPIDEEAILKLLKAHELIDD